MGLDIIVGTQWGDEGKGRIVDLFSAQADFVARFNGGDNAGHTVTVGQQTFKLHLVPSGVIHPNAVGVLGNGMVINPNTFLQELAQLRAAGVKIGPERLRISHAAHIITQGHLTLDAAQELARGAGQIGTTGRGIGPAYTDKASRSGLRMEDMLDLDRFREKMIAHIEEINHRLQSLYGAQPLDPQTAADVYVEYARELQPYITDTASLLHTALQKGQRVLAEGAQGTLLDLDHGTYPFVTSSSVTAPGAFTGLGLGCMAVNRVIGVTKTFQTRVGAGPFPTEVFGDTAERLRGTGSNPWDEFGTTTGRPRRVGWLDIVLLRYANRLNGLTEMVLTKLDVLTGLPSVQVCSAYRSGSEIHTDLPLGPTDLSPFTPVYEELPGWMSDVSHVRRWEDLPVEAQRYVQCVGDLVGVPVRWVSVGPEREQIVEVPL